MRARERGFGLRLLATTSSGIATHVPKLGFCFELSKATNVDYFNDVSGFEVFLKVSRFWPLKAQ